MISSTERMRNWRHKNPEKARAAVRRWRAANPEKARAKYRKWLAANPEKARAATNNWRSNNREKVRSTDRIWYARNKDRVNANRRKEYAKNQQERCEKISQKRRERKQKLVDILGGKCADCGYNEFLDALEFDHVRNKTVQIAPLISGGSWERVLEEAQKCELVCANCHRVRTAKRRE